MGFRVLPSLNFNVNKGLFQTLERTLRQTTKRETILYIVFRDLVYGRVQGPGELYQSTTSIVN